ncbi:4-(cytidine 5'-diphospho)-2-C-methyl-D-erythritol kinase [Agaribacter marinus]|uniref:4-diphosphocytidyl-2-C-methyl-D-erythritol kinase n=1 Tax=Agaribacter marinus TaxID=1431249 RepID=A0AA37SXM6_9ALTE|nr:4-(cytidine 5'-diphospho)-2-C-methyl-D-erythritol kinase [Agaribacter marinus]GLR70394.1 4-diphosphocytidyl-2-C-methyl-D-erythritol kinase [Agaribacter marinus]
MNVTWLPSPAKINLFLHICGRYENGYHQLQTLFQLLDVGDEIGIEVNSTGKLSMTTLMPGIPEDDNLIIKAAKTLQNYTKVSQGASFHVKKQLPMGGGIGGGSSNAATVLLGLNKLWRLNLPIDTLLPIAASLGADVPVFIKGQTGFAEGIGEKIIPVKTSDKWFLVANPGVHVSTSEVFQHPDLPRNTPLISYDKYTYKHTQNDCQELVCNLQPKVAKLLQWLVHYAPSRMTGTGASVFAMFSTEAEAHHVLRQLPDEFTGFVAKGTQQSILHTQLEGILR